MSDYSFMKTGHTGLIEPKKNFRKRNRGYRNYVRIIHE